MQAWVQAQARTAQPYTAGSAGRCDRSGGARASSVSSARGGSWQRLVERHGPAAPCGEIAVHVDEVGAALRPATFEEGPDLEQLQSAGDEREFDVGRRGL